MKLRTLLLASACFAATLAPMAYADGISIASGVTVTLSTLDTAQLGRPSRSGTPQSWSGDEAYTGQINTTTTYYTKTFDYAASLFAGAQYVDINSFSINNNTAYFMVAYAGSYDSTLANRGNNWLGDTGFSGNYQTNDGGDFMVVLPVGQDLILVINTTNAAAGGADAGIQFNVDAFGTSDYGDPLPAAVAPTPEPSSFITLGTGLIAVAGMARRRFRSAV